ncbi:Do family serine endopeptidase [Alistipes sp. CAG:268]|jgi:serine protease Do|nr:Do family serine endopeptidase [Alistipes sp. CAG:268]CDC97046.1 periplasmic serine protease Do/DeqQ family [Alistipes sp. CAG:268]HBW02271.1 Do family serine endopeptidase [Alistipes sp.]HIX97517.1 Do family serine endopeptidase [Candidatus Alistipes avistercoris]
MKKAFFVLGIVAVSAVAGGLTAWSMGAGKGTPEVQYIEREVERNPSLGTHFTAYEADKYPDLTYAAENAVKAVVNIEAIQQIEVPQRRSYDPFLEFFGIPQEYGNDGSRPQYREARAGGSGVIISKDGYVVTNNHVVDGATKLRVKLNDGRTFDAKLIGKDSATDVALLKIDGDDDLPTLPFGSSDALRLGEWVLAIGSPFDLQSTITAGIVSAKARNLGAIPNDFRIESFIQTDAAVNPGNSGGALVNTRGELVGINTLIKSQTGSYIGYSFAIPEAIVRKVVVDLKEYGVVQRAMLGIMFRPVDQDFLDSEGKELGIKELGGIYVASVVEGGSASEAGIRKGDIILSIDGVKVNDSATVQELIARRRPNDKVKISVKRDGDVKQIDVTLRNKAGKTELITKEDVDVVEALGGKFADAGTKLCRELDIRGGVQVVGVKSDGILARARVKQGFVITHINDRPVYAVSDLERMTEKVRSIDGIYPNGRSASYMLVE